MNGLEYICALRCTLLRCLWDSVRLLAPCVTVQFHCLNQKGAALILTQRAEKEIFFPSFCLVDSSEPPFFNPAYVHKGDFE